MFKPRYVPIMMLFMLTGCATYRLEKTDQLYLAQPYLPLPQDYLGSEGNGPVPYPEAKPGCGPVQRLDYSLDSRVGTLRPLPGMTLTVAETSDRRGLAEAVPSLAEWRWDLPMVGGCASGRPWSRRDQLVLRHLLSGARLQDATPDTDYFAKLVAAKGCAGTACDPDRLRAGLYDPFVRNLKVNFRRVELPGESGTGSASALKEVAPQPLAGRSLTDWYRALESVTAADFFQAPVAGNPAMAGLCAPLPGGRRTVVASSSRASQSDAIRRAMEKPFRGALPGGDPGQVDAMAWEDYRKALAEALIAAPSDGAPPQDDPSLTELACNFSFKSLVVDGADAWGTDGPLAARLALLNSGDRLLLFRPLTHRNLLDTGGRDVCGTSTGSGTDCTEEERISQGFVDFDLTFTVYVGLQRRPVQVSASTSVGELETELGAGASVETLIRPVRWLPQDLELIDQEHKTATRSALPKLVKNDAVTIRFVPKVSGGIGGARLQMLDALKLQLLLAPGDTILLKRAR